MTKQHHDAYRTHQRKRMCPGLLFAALLALGAGTIQSCSRDERGPLVLDDIAYAEHEGVKLRMDLALPSGRGGPWPIVVCVHGGGWREGDKSDMRPLMLHLAEHGYAAAAVQYRFAPAHQHPAQLEDLRAAVEHLAVSAEGYRIDPTRLAMLGESAGGQLALLAGMTQTDAHMPGRVLAVVNYCGSIDFRDWRVGPQTQAMLRASTGRDLEGLVADYLGTADLRSERAAEASPVVHVAPDAPAVLTIHGRLDLIVPLAHAEALHAALRQAGVSEELIVFEGAGHGWDGDDRARSDRATVEFLNTQLRDTQANNHQAGQQ